MQLAMSHVHADDMLRALLQQAVGKPAGRLTDIETALATRVDRRRGKRAFELEPSARNVARFGGIEQLELRRLGNLVAVLGDHAPGRAVAPAQSARDKANGLRAR